MDCPQKCQTFCGFAPKKVRIWCFSLFYINLSEFSVGFGFLVRKKQVNKRCEFGLWKHFQGNLHIYTYIHIYIHIYVHIHIHIHIYTHTIRTLYSLSQCGPLSSEFQGWFQAALESPFYSNWPPSVTKGHCWQHTYSNKSNMQSFQANIGPCFCNIKTNRDHKRSLLTDPPPTGSEITVLI